MRKKSLKFLVSMLCALLLGFNNIGFAMQNGDNPIDQAFATQWNEAGSTVEMNYVAEKYMKAWRGEMNHVAGLLKGKYKFDEDKSRIDDYIAAYEKVAGAAIYVEWLNWSNVDQNPAGRQFGTGAASGSLQAKANIYKQATMNLINAYHGQEGDSQYNDSKYHYIYSGNGRELTELMGEMRKSIPNN